MEGLPSVANYHTQASDDDASIDSTDSSVCVRHQDVMKAACIAWSNSSEAVRKAWNLRANFLNKLPVPGRLNEIVGTRNELEKTMIEALYLDWRGLAIKMRNSIKSNPRNEKCILVVSFGKERVKIMSQTYRRMVLSTLVRLQVFGKEYEKVAPHIVSK